MLSLLVQGKRVSLAVRVKVMVYRGLRISRLSISGALVTALDRPKAPWLLMPAVLNALRSTSGVC